MAVRLPEDEDFNDWLAVHVVDFFNRINIFYGTVCEYCTEQSCPIMSGGPKFEYYWADETHKKPQALPAPRVHTQCVHVLVYRVRVKPQALPAPRVRTQCVYVLIHVYSEALLI